MTTVHISGIVGFSLHVNQQFFTSCDGHTDATQGFIDERAPLNPTAVDPSRTADEREDEDERGDKMSEPTHKTRTEKRKNFEMDEKEKGLRAPLPEADSSHAISLRPSL